MRIAIFSIVSFFLFGCKAQNPDLETVKQLDINKYLGTWYEIARLPNRFEKDLTCITATYELKSNGKIRVINQGRKSEDENIVDSAIGTAWLPNINEQGRLKVRFFWPFSGDYYVIVLDENYRYALVGSPSRKYLWVLSKDKELDVNVYQYLIQVAENKGFDTSKMILVDQRCH